MKTLSLADLRRWFWSKWPPRRGQLIWAAGGLLIGIVLTVVVLVGVAPEPPAVAKPPVGTSNIAITIDDTALTDLATAGIAQAGLPFSVTNVQAHIQPNEVVQISGDVPILGGLAIRRLSATAHLDVRSGHVVMHISQASVGSLALPSILVTAIENALNVKSAQLSNSLVVGNTRYVLSDISSTTGQLTLHLKQQ